jgi:hypothetical protein
MVIVTPILHFLDLIIGFILSLFGLSRPLE